MPATFGIVELFAGPGGLGEGFASLRVGDHSPFQIGISVEKEASAHRTKRKFGLFYDVGTRGLNEGQHLFRVCRRHPDLR